jgi:hypothetical protein
MRNVRYTRRATCSVLTAAVAAVVATGADARFLTKNLEVCDQGSFFIGGVPKVTHYATSSTAAATPAQITVGQMYVQFQVPEKSGKWPLIMVHGSTHSGAALESTPHYTEGWAPYTVRKGLATYVVDQPGRGRSGNDESRIHEGKALLTDLDTSNDALGAATIPNIGRITDNGSYTAWFGHLVEPGTATTCLNNATDPSKNILNCELMPHGWRADDPSLDTVHPNPAGYGPKWAFTRSPFVYPANVDYTNTGTWGPAPYGPAAAYKQHYYRQLLPNYEATLPGSTCPSCGPLPANQAIAPANTWSPANLAELVIKLGGGIVATHSQSGIQGHHMVRVLKERGKLHLLKGLITVEGSCSLPNSGLTAADFDNIPYMAIKGDYTLTSTTCGVTVDEINARRAAGFGKANAEYIQLDDPKYKGKFNGVTHMMMDDTVALKVMDVMLAWADKAISNPPLRGHQCNSPRL